MPKASTAHKGRLRPAGRLELLFESLQRLDLTSWVVVSARYDNAASTRLDKANLFPALEQVIREHVALAARIPLSPSPRVWVRLPSIDLNKVVTFLDKSIDELPSLLQDFFAKPTEDRDDLPYWKLLVLRDNTVVFAYNHTMGDGKSGAAFHHGLLTSLNTVNARIATSSEPLIEHSGIVKQEALPQDVSLVPPLEEAMDLSMPFLRVVREIACMALPFLRRKDKGAWTGEQAPKTRVYDVTIRILQYTPAEVSSLVALSREHGTTLTGTLHTLALVLISRLIHSRAGKGGERKFTKVATAVPVSLRRYTGAPPTAICNHVGDYKGYHPLLPPDAPALKVTSIHRETFPWDRAAAMSAKLQREVARAGARVGMIKYLYGRYDNYLLGRLGGKRYGGLELSNLGAFPPLSAKSNPERASSRDKSNKGEGARSGGFWTIQETAFVQADVTLGSALKMSVAGTPTGGLGISLTWGEDAIDPAFAQEFATGFEEGMRALMMT
ncbi:alcohol acetyltransferase [Fomes fomentarius]|nr:alcohol acetyltransferase [Fomes fomentarius]